MLTASALDLRELLIRESEQVEWKENVADENDVVKTLSAFANDLANLGGGYVVCGAREDKDEHGFPRVTRIGLTANRLREIEGKVIARARDLVSPPLTPLVQEIPTDSDDRRILVFVQPATGSAHTFRAAGDGAKHYVRVSRSTIEARNGVLRDLLVRKGALEPWDRRPCPDATVADLDLLALRDTLQRIGVYSVDAGVETYLSDDIQISPFVPPLCAREPLTGALRPRNFAILLFGRHTQRHIPGAYCIFSLYPGTDRSDTHAERHEIAGGLIEQARKLTELLDVQSHMAFDKSDPASPNANKYPRRALYEAMGNALAHRDYELWDPTRITVFSDRIEIVSPGGLPTGVDKTAFALGKAGPRWRNQSLAWFLNRLQFAQAEGQGIPTILRVMREEGCPPPTLDSDDSRVLCLLPAHPRHALLRDLREVEQTIALGHLEKAAQLLAVVLARDPLNYRAVQLFAEVHQALDDPAPVFDYIKTHHEDVFLMPFSVLLQLSEALMATGAASSPYAELSRHLLAAATRGRLAERDVRRAVVAMIRSRDEQEALVFLADQVAQNPEWRNNASLAQLRGDALIGMAKHCRVTATRPGLPRGVRQRAWREFHSYLADAEKELRQALTLTQEDVLIEQIQRNLDYLSQLSAENQPRSHRAK